jgi:hypothetical protein
LLFQVLKIENKIYGYISAQPGNGVVSIGPWVMLDDTVSPLTLLKSLAFEVGDTLLRIGILENNSKAIETVKSIDSFEETEYCWRMALGSSNELGMSDHLYAIGSAAKG